MTTLETKIFSAIKKNDFDPLVELVDKQCFLTNDLNFFDDKGNTPLTLATMLLNSDIVDMLLQFGATPHVRNKQNETAIDVLSKCIEKEKAKLPSRNDRPSKNHTRIGLHWQINAEKILALLIAKLQNPAELTKALRLSLENNFPCIFEKLLRLGVEPN